MDLWGSLWGNGKEEVSARVLHRNCVGCFATQEATERNLTASTFSAKILWKVETLVFKQLVREKTPPGVLEHVQFEEMALIIQHAGSGHDGIHSQWVLGSKNNTQKKRCKACN